MRSNEIPGCLEGQWVERALRKMDGEGRCRLMKILGCHTKESRLSQKGRRLKRFKQGSDTIKYANKKITLDTVWLMRRVPGLDLGEGL